MKTITLSIGILFLFFLSSCSTGNRSSEANLAKAVDHLFSPLQQTDNSPYTYSFDYTYEKTLTDNKTKVRKGSFTYARQSEEKFSCTFSYKMFEMTLTRFPTQLFVYIPHSKTLLLDENPGLRRESRFSLENVFRTSLLMEPRLNKLYDTLNTIRGENFAEQLAANDLTLIKINDPKNYFSHQILADKKPLLSLQLRKDKIRRVTFHLDDASLTLKLKIKAGASLFDIPEEEDINKRIVIKNSELHRSFVRGLARITEIKYHESQTPVNNNFVRSGPYGKYRMKDGQRIIKLKGNSYQIGWQHGKFLANEVRRVSDSTLYLVGLIYSIKKSKWFFDDIRNALTRLDKFTPKEYLEEMRGVADGDGMDYDIVHMANYFPALFHCSGFTLKNSATKNRKLYHGRILDYMCEVGLQYNAVLFAVEKEGKVPFANVSFASFIGSVSG
ncbi:MAG: hypothetical protein HRT88_17120, partial [Lentisphaeraceae bacterium]|nr:hypothetical protein [Lentisphaeraceae bacterium]